VQHIKCDEKEQEELHEAAQTHRNSFSYRIHQWWCIHLTIQQKNEIEAHPNFLGLSHSPMQQTCPNM
jgi:hypothetical protein